MAKIKSKLIKLDSSVVGNVRVGGVKAPTILKPKRKLYLAYGQNLHIKTMQWRCPDAKPATDRAGNPRKRMLSNAQLVFRGVADINWSPGARAPAGLWWISAADEAALDRIEGYPHAYSKFNIWLDKAKTMSALIYLMNDRHGIHPPSAHYVSAVRDGYRNFGLDERFLDEAIEQSFTDKNPTEQTRARRGRQRLNSLHEKLVPIPLSVQQARLDAARDRAEAERAALDAAEQEVLM